MQGEQVLLSLGSNVSSEQLHKAEEMLQGFFSALRFSRVITSPAIGMPEGTSDFSNSIAYGYTELPYDALKSFLKSVEQQLGRTAEDKARGVIAIDIDILLYGHQLFKPQDWHRPYNETLIAEFGL